VVGAGMAGITLARSLVERGGNVVVFDKGRSCGGRMSTRRRMVDHGAQYFTARDPAFRDEVGAWEERGLVERWPAKLRGGPAETRFCGTPHMASLCIALAADLVVRSGMRIDSMACGADGWELYDSSGAPYGPFEAVAVTAPAPQAAGLLAPAPEMRARVERVVMEPCWAGMFVFDGALGPDFDGAFLERGGMAWLARREREAGEAWVLHAGPAWSRDRLDRSRDEVLPELRAALAAEIGRSLPEARYEQAHLWRHAKTSEPLGEPCLWDPLRRVGVAGDWCTGARVEAAWQSGRALAEAMLR